MKTLRIAACDIAYSTCKASGKNKDCNTINSLLCSTCGFGVHIYLGCLAMALFTNEWNLVGDGLPEELMEVNVMDSEDMLSVGILDDGMWVVDSEFVNKLDIVKWKPIETELEQ